MKKRIIIAVVFVLALISILALTVFAVDVEINIEISTGQTLVPVDYKFYLPAGADITKVKINHSHNVAVTYGNGIELKSGDTVDLSGYKTRDNYHYECYRIELKSSTGSTTYTFYAADNLSAVFIDTLGIGVNAFKLNQMENVDAKVEILNKDGSYEYQDGELDFTEIKVRGNTTPDLYKKPYQLKLKNKTDLFGLGEGKTWILLANYLDQSFLRNATMFELAEKLGMNASDFISVDVYIDGCYEGVYLLCEKVQVQSERVNIRDLEKEMKALDKNYGKGKTTVVTSGSIIEDSYLTEYKYYNDVKVPEDITGGYLIELDNTNKDNRKNMEESYFITDSGNYYVIKSPEVCSKEMIEYIALMFSEMEEAFTNADGYNRLRKHYSEYMDVESFAYGYIMCEFGRTYDAGSNSVYFHKDADKDGVQSKIVKGPLWDCDNSLANIVRGNAHLTDNYWAATRTPWNKLTQHDDFMEVVAEKFEGIYDTICDMADDDGFIYQEIEKIGSSMHMDRVRNHLNTKDLWPVGTGKGFNKGLHYEADKADKAWFNRPALPESEWAFPTYTMYSDGIDNTEDTVIGTLRTHISARANWLATEWGCDVELRERVDHVYDNDHDATCNDCGYERIVYIHEYTAECDETCNCGYKRTDAKEHTGGKATCTAKARCEVCRQEYGEPAGHKGGKATCKQKARCEVCRQAYGDLAIHQYSDVWVGNETYHWQECKTSGCVSIQNKQKHNLSEGGDEHHLSQCSLCREWYFNHTFSDTWSYNADSHWKGCVRADGCVAVKNMGNHIFPTDWTVVKEATNYENGLEERECFCGAKETREIPSKKGCNNDITETLVTAFISSGTISLGYLVFKKSRKIK